MISIYDRQGWGFCWDCYWGWPKPVAEIYLRAREKLGDESPLDYGPGHIVWADENFDQAEWCLEHFEEYRHGFADTALEIVKQSLIELSALPIEIRCVTPEDYDGKHPEKYPPSAGIEMIQIPAMKYD